MVQAWVGFILLSQIAEKSNLKFSQGEKFIIFFSDFVKTDNIYFILHLYFTTPL